MGWDEMGWDEMGFVPMMWCRSMDRWIDRSWDDRMEGMRRAAGLVDRFRSVLLFLIQWTRAAFPSQ